MMRTALISAGLLLLATPASAENWVEQGRQYVRGERGMSYLDADIQVPRQGYVKFRAKYVFENVQTNPESTLKYKEIRSSFEVNCATLKIRHLLSTIYGPKGGVQYQYEGEKIEFEPDLRTARSLCARVS